MSLADTYTLRLIIFYSDYPDIYDKKEFIVRVYNPCQIFSPVFSVIEQEYFVGSGPAFYNVQVIAENSF